MTQEQQPPVNQYADNSQSANQGIPQTSTLAVIALVIAVISWFFLPIITGIIAIILAIVARKKIVASAGAITGKGLATAALIISLISTISWIVFLIVWFSAMFAGLPKS